MLPENDVTIATGPETGQKKRWYQPLRCSICTNFIWFHPTEVKESIEAPEPHLEWVLCKPCHEALLVEMRRSIIRSSVRLRIAIGLVAAERSPNAYTVNAQTRERKEFEREFAWFVWAIVLFGLLHVAIFFVLLAVPR